MSRTAPSALPLPLAVRRRLASGAALLALAGCAASAAEPPSLAGSHWQLVDVQSMDDRQGRTVPTDPTRFTMSLGADGRVAFRLDCNRAASTWQREPGPDGGATGQLQFGPLAGTRRLCPPPRLDERVLRDMTQVRSYRLEGELLHLSLMADGGIYTWRRLPGPPQ
jgi:heat shock protein HslJ